MADPRALIFSVTVVAIGANPLISPSIPEVLFDLNAPTWMAGGVIAAAGLPSVVLAPMVGALSDRLGRRVVLFWSLMVFGLAGVGCALVPTWEALLVVRLIQGVGGAGPIAIAIAMVTDHWHGVDRVRVLGQNLAVLTGAMAVLPVAAGALASAASWRTPMWLFSSSLVVAAFVARSPSFKAVPVRTEPVGSPVALLRDRTFTASIVAAGIIFALIFGVIFTVLPLLADARFGIAPTQRGLLLGAPSAMNSLAALQAGRLARLVGSKRVVVLATLLLAVAIATVALAPFVAMLVVGVLAIGLAEGSAMPQLQRVAADRGGDGQRGLSVSLFLATSRMGQSTGPIAAGTLLPVLGIPLVLGLFSLAAAGVGGGLVAGGIGDRRKKQRRSDDG